MGYGIIFWYKDGPDDTHITPEKIVAGAIYRCDGMLSDNNLNLWRTEQMKDLALEHLQ